MVHNYAIEKLSESIHQLAVGKGDVRSRILAISHYLVRLNKTDFPKELQEEFLDIMNNLTKRGPIKHPYKDEIAIGSFENTIRHLRNTTAAKLAERIFKLYHDTKYSAEN